MLFRSIRGRWPEAEPYIKTDSNHAFSYAHDVIKGRWPEVEPVILNSSYAQWYRIHYIPHTEWTMMGGRYKKKNNMWIR